jgi:hypothetical protein
LSIILAQKYIHKNYAHSTTEITENYMTLSFTHVYFSPNISNGYKIFEKQRGKNKKENGKLNV